MPKMVLDDFVCPDCGTLECDVFHPLLEGCDDICVVCPNCGESMNKVVSGAHIAQHGAKGLQRFTMGLPGRPDHS